MRNERLAADARIPDTERHSFECGRNGGVGQWISKRNVVSGYFAIRFNLNIVPDLKENFFIRFVHILLNAWNFSDTVNIKYCYSSLTSFPTRTAFMRSGQKIAVRYHMRRTTHRVLFIQTSGQNHTN